MRFVGMTAIVAIALASCSKQPTTHTDQGPPPSEATPEPPRVVAATPPPTQPEPSPASTPELAPEGVFYLIAAARVETESGIHGLPPGTGVKRVREGIYLTPAGELPLAAEQLTNDMAVARAARDAAAAKQAALQQRGMADAGVAATQARMTEAETVSGHAAALREIDQKRAELQLAGLKQQKIALEAQIEVLKTKRSKENYNEYIKGRTVTSTTVQQLAGVRAQLKTVTNQIEDLESNLRTRK